ncbi:MAG: hypothetical protein IPL96_06495 [Holophagaceae bacterium]|nr:hypothetical protein [Holophagaceae bacterium]
MKKTLFFLLVFGFSMANAQNRMDPLSRFKRRIGYVPTDIAAGLDPRKEVNSPQPGMVGAWSGIKDLPQFSQGWEIRSFFNGRHPEYIESGLRMMNVENDITVEIFNYPNEELAERAFWVYAISHNVSIPYGATRRKIGHISAKHEKMPIVWVQKDNYYFRINSKESVLDPEVLAEWLVAYADTKLVSDVTPYLPVPQRIVVEPELPRVGQEFEIRIEMAGRNTPGRYVFREALGQDIAKFMDQFVAVGRDGLTAESLMKVLRAKKPGKGVYKYTLSDRQTSLFHQGEVEIDVTP